MFRKLFAVLTLVLAIPALANAAWTVKASTANPTFGTIDPAGFNAYADTDQADKTFTVTPGGNYKVSAILVDNVDVKSGLGTQTVTVHYKPGTTILVAKFAANQFSCTAGNVVGGSITSTTAPLVNAGANKSFTILPAPGKRLLTVTDSAVGNVAVTNANGMVYTINDVQADHVVTATFGGVTANAGLPQNVKVDSTVTLKGAGTAFNAPTYEWTLVYAPAGSTVTSASLGAVAQPTFTADKVGTYNFKLKVTDSVDATASAVSYTAVSVYADFATAANAVLNQCVVCHTANGTEFTGSNHWNNARNVQATGTCAAACHFKSQTTAVACNTCHATGQFNGTTMQNPTLSGMEAPLPTAAGTCFVCHSGSSHGTPTNNFLKSSHYNGDHAKLYYNMDKKACVACHNPHSTETSYNGCLVSCHKNGKYGIYSSNGIAKAPHFNATGTTGYAYIQDVNDPNNTATCVDCHGHNNTVNAGWAESGHGKLSSPWNRVSASNKALDLQASPWLAASACARCHSAKGYAYFVNSGFKSMTTITAVVKNNETTGLAYSTYSPLTCNSCHTSAEGALRTPKGAAFKGYYGISTARNYFTANVVDSIQYAENKNSNGCMPCHSPRNQIGQNIKSAFLVAGPDAKLGAGSFGVHDGADYVGPIFNGKGGYDFTVQNGAANNEFAYQDRARHQRIANYGTGAELGYNNTGVTQGSCVFCHYGSAESHSAEITADTYANACSKCHPASFDATAVANAAAENAAAVKALGNLIAIQTWKATGSAVGNGTDMSFNAAGALTGDNAIAEKNIGANFNYKILSGGDAAAFAHNPSYARRLLTDSIDWLDDNVMNGSATATIFKNLSSATYLADSSKKKDLVALTTAEVTAAQGRLNNPGCMGCHFGTGSTGNGETIPGIEQMPHYNDGTAKTSEGPAYNSAQFVVPGSQCNNCHGYGHGTDSPGYSFSTTAFPTVAVDGGRPSILKQYAESAHGEVNGLAWTHYDFKQADRKDCSVCHTTKGFISGLESANANSGKVVTATVWGTTGDTSKQVLGCNTCHSSTSWATSVRTINGGYKASMGGWGKADVLDFGDVGESNVCIPCHASRENGASIIASVTVTNAGFKNPHYLAAAATFYGKGGFRYYGATDTPTVNVNAPDGNTFSGNVPAYSSEYGVVVDGIIVTNTNKGNTPLGGTQAGRYAAWSHGKLGMDNYTTSALTSGADVGTAKDNAGKVRGSGNKGQCVACHLGPTNTHTFDAFETAKATYGTNATNAQGCFGCHNGEDMKEVAENDELPNFKRMMAFFQWNLQKKGMYYNAAKNPYFFAEDTYTNSFTNWGATLDEAKKTMGAAQNFKLLDAEKGAHVHNRSYMRQLVFDSVQYLQFGAVTYSNKQFYGTTGSENLEDVLKFSEYSTAITPVGGGVPTDGGVSIQALKNYIISSSSRTNPINLNDGTVPASATYGAVKFFRR